MNVFFAKVRKAGAEYIDLNYPEHVKDIPAERMKEMLKNNDLKLNGLATRFRSKYVNGELGNSDDQLSEDALKLCLDAIDYLKAVGGKTLTIWLGYDGFDYPFQIDYEKVWDKITKALKTITAYDPNIMISIEYKPYEERAYAFLDSVGTTSLMIREVGADNLGITLDLCHLYMKHENPAYSLTIVNRENKLCGVHLNDGYGVHDDGLMVGMVSPLRILEFLYYLKKYAYDGIVYFDTFPTREDPGAECEANIQMVEAMNKWIDEYGMENIATVIESNDAIKIQKMVLNCKQGGFEK